MQFDCNSTIAALHWKKDEISIICISVVSKFEVIWTNEKRLMGQRSWRSYYYVIWKNGLEGILLPANMAAAIKRMEIF